MINDGQYVLIPDVKTLRSETRSMAVLLKGLSGISVICSGYTCVFVLHHAQLMMYLWVSLFMPFQ